MPEPVLHDDWPRPRFVAEQMHRPQHGTGDGTWAVYDRVFCFQVVAKGRRYDMVLTALLMESEWLVEDARVAAAA